MPVAIVVVRHLQDRKLQVRDFVRAKGDGVHTVGKWPVGEGVMVFGHGGLQV
jgi:hypothetical protein